MCSSDLERMTQAEWQKLYHDAWRRFYSPAHMETVMRRSVATNAQPGNMPFLLMWFYYCIVLEDVDPLEGGYLRRKYRRDRRPGFPLESRIRFYPHYAGDFLKKHGLLAQLIWRYGRLRRRLKRDPEARNYMDEALTPVVEEGAEEMPATGTHQHPAAPDLVTLHS